jgi:hypothetical protein
MLFDDGFGGEFVFVSFSVESPVAGFVPCFC